LQSIAKSAQGYSL